MKRTKHKNSTLVNEKTLIVSVDIGKEIHYGYMRAPGGVEVKPFPFRNTGGGFSEFMKKIRTFQRSRKLDEVVVGFESSGCYAEPLCHYMRKRGVRLVQTNPMHTKRLKELTGNSPNKTDRKDPRVIADIIFLGHALSVIVPEGAAAELRRLTQARESAVKRNTAVLNQLHTCMFLLFPEFIEVMNSISSASSLYLIERYPTPKEIIALGIDSLAAVLRKVSHGKLRRERASELFAAARESVGITEGTAGIIMEIAHLVEMIRNTQRFIRNAEDQMAICLTAIPYNHCILSIKGIGVVTAAGLIGEVGDFRQYGTVREITKLAGFDLYEVSSGRHKGQRRISKRGRSAMRRLLYYAALNTVKSDGIMYEVYHRMLSRGMPSTKALVAVARKLLALIYALARDNTVFIEQYTHISTSITAA